jgi:hypothetical protein
MKTLLKFMLVLACISLFVTCQKSDQILDDLSDGTLKKAQPITVSVPFKANLTVWDHSDYTDRSCGDPPVFLLTMEGFGTSTHLGRLTTKMTFCCDVSTGIYHNTDIVFVSANGDELYCQIPIGYIIPNEGENSEYYTDRFNDPIIFNGGTGRFEGAKGDALTNAFVHYPVDENDVWHTDFFSEGTLVMVKSEK